MDTPSLEYNYNIITSFTIFTPFFLFFENFNYPSETIFLFKIVEALNKCKWVLHIAHKLVSQLQK